MRGHGVMATSVAALVAMSGTSACYVQQKGDRAARVIGAASLASEAGTAVGDIQFTVRIVKVQGQDIKRVAKLRASQLAAAPTGGRSPAGQNGGNGESGQRGQCPASGQSAATAPSAGGDLGGAFGSLGAGAPAPAAPGGPKPAPPHP